ncbi:hypothetical protein [uncultured Psychroserpens sp.]|uniref:hypothetical protein n=1 Tax=uncultured Psychroserpens sp. TaxID=255436 RepID=UPI002629D43F|nr:hypothetical protein [uncultured Psychroserpens sp.]
MKKYAAHIITVFTVLMFSKSFGQELPEVIPPSPTVANLMQFEEVPVSYYTGQPNISIPIYSKALNGDLSVNIGLSYNTQGIKINNVSGWTGTGWSLNAGGVISRTVRDVPDELKANSYGYSGIKTGVLHNDDYWNYNTLSGTGAGSKEEYDWRAVGSSIHKYDNDVDLYQFNFMGYSGRFVILREGLSLVPKLISKSAAIDINFNQNSSGSRAINSFTITDPNGYVYEFTEVETTSSEINSGSVPQGDVGVLNPSGTNETIAINSAWHLTAVKTSNGIALATFTYSTENESYVTSVTRTYNKILEINGNSNVQLADISDPYNQGKLKPEQTVSYYVTTSPTKKLASISFKDGTSVAFLKDNANSHPETTGAILKTINIKDTSGAVHKSYTMSYETTTDTNTSPDSHRLWLMKVRETAGGVNHDYHLAYNDKANLPGFDSNMGDDWGYYSDIGVTTINCSSPAANVYSEATISTGLLSSISYPTGGTKEFEFEHHTYSYYGNQTLGYDEYMKNPRNTEPKNETQSFTYQNPSQFSSLPMSLITGTLPFAQDIFISSTITTPAAGSPYLNNHRVYVIDSNNVTHFVELNENCYKINNLPAGAFTVGFTYNTNLDTSVYTVSGNIEIDYIKKRKNFTPREEMIGGGVRIKNIAFRDSIVDPSSPVKNINYVYDDEANTLRSSGVIDAELDRLTRKYIHTANNFVAAAPNYTSPGASTPVKYEITEVGVRAQLSQGEYVGYRQVKVYETGNGYTIYNHTSAYEFPSPSDVFDLPNPHPAPNNDYRRGLLTRKRIFREDDKPLQEITHYDTNGVLKYDFVEDAMFTMRSSYKKDTCPWFIYYDQYSNYISLNPDAAGGNDPSQSSGYYSGCNTSDVTQNSRIFYSGWAKLEEVTTTDFFYDGPTTRTKTVRQTYEYNDENFQVSQEDAYYEKSGVQEHLQTKYFYAVPAGATPGSNFSATLVNMRNLNMINTVLETESYRNSVKMNETHNIYHPFHTNFVALQEVKVAKESQGLISIVQFHDYDTHGNLVEVSKTDGARMSYLWGHNKTLPIAQLSNAEYADIPSTYKSISGNIDFTTEANLRNVSALSDAQISIFHYDPIIGLTKSIDQRGYKMYYEYDAFDRLEYIKDNDFKIVSKNSYHYKNQN